MSAPASRSPSDVIRMTEKQAREAHKLVRKECCNYVDGMCVALDCPCPQLITRSLNCKWFHHAVLPGNTSLYLLPYMWAKDSAGKSHRQEAQTAPEHHALSTSKASNHAGFKTAIGRGGLRFGLYGAWNMGSLRCRSGTSGIFYSLPPAWSLKFHQHML